MRLFVEEADRGQCTLLPECLDDFIRPRPVADMQHTVLETERVGVARALLRGMNDI
jgi:hypothetical protein